MLGSEAGKQGLQLDDVYDCAYDIGGGHPGGTPRRQGLSEQKRSVKGHMKDEYDFKEGRRGPVLRTPLGKTRITIRIDDDILGWFRNRVNGVGGGSYQTLINNALRAFMEEREQDLEGTLRQVVREELARYSTTGKAVGYQTLERRSRVTDENNREPLEESNQS